MIRIGAFLVGLFFSGWLMISALMGAFAFVTNPAAPTAEHEFHKKPNALHLASDGPIGKFDRAQLQRGYQVYKEVCSACHSLKHVALRDLQSLGYNEGQVKTLAKDWQIADTNTETGEAITRPGKPSDHFPLVYANDTAARAANNNAIPPDLSLMTKARHGGASYVYSLLTGYAKPDPELAKRFPEALPGKTTHHNPYFANLNLAMAPPLTADGQVTYGPGNPKPTVKQMAEDVSAFLVWTAEPELESRKRVGWATLGFLLIFAFLAWGAYQNVWADKKKK